MLEIKNVYKTFNPGTVNQKVALNDLNLTLEDGDFVTVIGGNGAGKSTMLNAVAGVWPVDMGKIIIDGKDITRLPEHKRAKYIGRVFQDPMIGTAATNEYSAARARFSPSSIPPIIVEPEREKPGHNAMHWQRPMPSASLGVTSSILELSLIHI